MHIYVYLVNFECDCHRLRCAADTDLTTYKTLTKAGATNRHGTDIQVDVIPFSERRALGAA